MVKAILHGCNGAMGHVISEMAEKDEQLQMWQAGQKIRNSITDTVLRLLKGGRGRNRISRWQRLWKMLFDYCGDENPVLSTTGLSEEQLLEWTLSKRRQCSAPPICLRYQPSFEAFKGNKDTGGCGF